MNAIKNLFSFLGTVGEVIRTILGQKVDVTIHLAPLPVQLEDLVRDVLVTKDLMDEPAAFLQHTIEEMIRNNRKQLQALMQLDVADITLGTEAFWHADSIPDDLGEVFMRYAKRYIVPHSPDVVAARELIPPAIRDAFDSALSDRDESSLPLYEEFPDVPIIRHPSLDSTRRPPRGSR